MRSIVGATLTFGAVFVPVNVASSAQQHEVKLRTLHTCGTPLNQVFRCPKCDEIAEVGDTRKGYELVKKQFVEVNDDEFREITGERTREIVLTKFIPAGEINLRLVDKQYALTPSDTELLRRPYKLIIDAMGDDMVGIGKSRLWGRERPVAVIPNDGLLWMLMLNCHDELVLTSDEELKMVGVEVTSDEVKLARQFIELKAGKLEASDLTSATYERQISYLDALTKGKKPRKRKVEKEKKATVGELTETLAAMLVKS